MAWNWSNVRPAKEVCRLPREVCLQRVPRVPLVSTVPVRVTHMSVSVAVSVLVTVSVSVVSVTVSVSVTLLVPVSVIVPVSVSVRHSVIVSPSHTP